MNAERGPFQMLVRQHGGSLALPVFERNDFATAWVDRSCDLLGTTRRELLRWLDDDGDSLFEGDLDLDPNRLIHALRRWAAKPEAWGSMKPLLGQPRLEQAKRVSFCPLCFAEDLRRHQLPRFRAHWTWSWLTHCPGHGTPLFRWHLLDDLRTGERRLPPAWVARFLGRRCRNFPIEESELARRTQGQLRLARFALRFMSDDSAFAWFWRQQVQFERQLHHLRAGRMEGDILGGFGDRKAFLRTVDDMGVLFSTNFTRSEREPWGSTWKVYLGPDTLFGGFERGAPYTGVASRGSVGILGDPRARRTVIALIVRILYGFRTDVFCSGRGAVVEPGFNALTNDLKSMPDAAKAWCAERWHGWSEVVRRGFQKSL